MGTLSQWGSEANLYQSSATTASCPSANTSASTPTSSPMTRLIGYCPQSTCGRTFSITTRAGAGLVFWLLLVRLEEDHRERRQCQRKGMTVFLVRHGDRIGAALVAEATAAVEARVAVEDLAPVAAARHADAVVDTRHRGEVVHREDRRRALVAQAQEGKRALLPVPALHPAEAVRREVFAVER